jgi:hypothetical protein
MAQLPGGLNEPTHVADGGACVRSSGLTVLFDQSTNGRDTGGHPHDLPGRLAGRSEWATRRVLRSGAEPSSAGRHLEGFGSDCSSRSGQDEWNAKVLMVSAKKSRRGDFRVHYSWRSPGPADDNRGKRAIEFHDVIIEVGID